MMGGRSLNKHFIDKSLWPPSRYFCILYRSCRIVLHKLSLGHVFPQVTLVSLRDGETPMSKEVRWQCKCFHINSNGPEFILQLLLKSARIINNCTRLL